MRAIAIGHFDSNGRSDGLFQYDNQRTEDVTNGVLMGGEERKNESSCWGN